MKLIPTIIKLAKCNRKLNAKKMATIVKAAAVLAQRFIRVEKIKDELRKQANANLTLAKFAMLPQYFSETVQLVDGKK